MAYKYEMHQHTWPCSHCGHADPEKLVRTMKNDGYTGLVITDHFYFGNTGIDRSLPWDEFCKAYIDNYLAAKRIGDEIDFDVLFGVEENVGEGKEVLLYGITPEFILSHPELRNSNLELIYKLANEFGALVIQAHPFRNRDYIPDPLKRLDPAFLDGYEVFNTANKPEDNKLAFDTYKDSGKIFTAGSDWHRDETTVRSGIETDVRIKTEKQLADILKSGNYKLFGTAE